MIRPFSPESYLRRHCGMMMSRTRVAFKSSSLGGLMTKSRLPVRGRNSLNFLRWLSIWFLFLQDPVACLCEMSRYSSYRNRMTFPGTNTLVEVCCVPEAHAMTIPHDRVGSLGICPLQIMIGIRWCSTIMTLASGGMYPRSCP